MSLVLKNGLGLIGMMCVIAALGGCTMPKEADAPIIDSAAGDEGQADDGQVDEGQAGLAQEGLHSLPASLFFTWDLSSGTMISAPIWVQEGAISACRERGYDISYMVNIALDGDQAIGEFGCRGAD